MRTGGSMLKFDSIVGGSGGGMRLFKGKRKSSSAAAKSRVSVSHSVDSDASGASGQPLVENHYVTSDQIKSGNLGPRTWTPPSHFVTVKPMDLGLGGGLAPWHVDGSSTVCAQNADGAKGKLMTARCITSYRATHAMELTIREGDMVYNVHDVGIKDWLKGSIGGMYGHFPSANVVVLGAATQATTVDFSPSASTDSLPSDGESTPGILRSNSMNHARILPTIPGQEDQLQYAEVVRNTGDIDDADHDRGDGGSIYDELVYDEMNYEAMTITQSLKATGDDVEVDMEAAQNEAEEV